MAVPLRAPFRPYRGIRVSSTPHSTTFELGDFRASRPGVRAKGQPRAANYARRPLAGAIEISRPVHWHGIANMMRI